MLLLGDSINYRGLNAGLGRHHSVDTACDLGIYIDVDVSTQSHVQQPVAGCFAVLHQLRSTR